jgi:hypothetical protein
MSVPYPDPISPRCDPELLGRLDHDPFGVMLTHYPRRPHVWVTADQLELVRARIRRGGWARLCQDWLLENCVDRKGVLNQPLPSGAETPVKLEVLSLAMRNALACHLQRTSDRWNTALKAFRRLAEYGVRTPVSARGALVANGSLNESHALKKVGITYDLLAALGLSDRDDRLFRSFLKATRAASNACDHYSCGNHNTWSLVGRLSVSLALEDAQGLHDSLYGCAGGKRWRYGLIHQLRHDILSDGMHWERTMGYHFYSMMGLTYAMDFLANSGRDLWHYAFPTLKQDDLHDAHRAYGPNGSKTLQAAYDAPFRLAFGNGDLSLLSDSGLANMRGTWIWGVIYDKAYEAYRQPHYAGLLNQIEKDYPERQRPGIPMSLHTHFGDMDFVRLKYDRYPAGRISFGGRGRVGLTGVQQGSSSLLPVFGAAVLRANSGRRAPAAHLYYGPHIAGHQHPAALHTDIHIGGRRLTDAARLSGYNDPLYLTWGRTTVAANTVVVDGQSMFPYDFPTESIWECDRWRDSISDGELCQFQVGSDFSAVRAINRNVYPGVLLDRTIVVSEAGVLDAYRVVSDSIRQFDYVFHCTGRIPVPANAKPIRLGTARGYQHLTAARVLRSGKPPILAWQTEGDPCQCVFAAIPGARLILAQEPEAESKSKSLGELTFDPARTTVLQRVRANAAVFASFWTVGADSIAVQRVQGRANGDLVLTAASGSQRLRWELPQTGPVRFCEGSAIRPGFTEKKKRKQDD